VAKSLDFFYTAFWGRRIAPPRARGNIVKAVLDRPSARRNRPKFAMRLKITTESSFHSSTDWILLYFSSVSRFCDKFIRLRTIYTH
jgi:hypothetical protein